MRKTQIAFGILSVSLVFLIASIVYSYEPTWHGVDYIQDGNVIKSKETAENFLYLYKTVEGLNNCNLSLKRGVACDYKVSCNCGKYGCSVCSVPGEMAVLVASCKDGTEFEFEGVCMDKRVSSTCGKYGCEPSICKTDTAKCTALGGGVYQVCELNKDCYQVSCDGSNCYRISEEADQNN